jgi:hypothetical protein
MAVRLVAGLVVAGVLSGCGLLTDPSEGRAQIATIPATVCHPVSVRGVLRSDPADSHAVWLEDETGKRVDVVFPTGYWAEFRPLGEGTYIWVYAPDGRLAATTTDVVTGACDAGMPGAVLLMPLAS